MAVAVWARQASPGGTVCVGDRGQARGRCPGWGKEESRDQPPQRGSEALR